MSELSEHEERSPEQVVEHLPEVGANSSRQEYLYAFAVQAEIANYVRVQCIEADRERLSDIMAAWVALQPRVNALLTTERGLAETLRVDPVPDEHRPLIDQFLADPLFQRSFSQLPVEVALVEADKLVAGQRMVNLEYVNRLAEQYGAQPSIEDLLRICVSPTRDLEPIQHLEVAPNTHVFSSPNSDVRFLNAYLKQALNPDDLMLAEYGGLPAAAIIAFVGYGAAPVNVLAVGERLVLNNGFHRVYALRRLGIAQVPVVIQRVSNPQLEFPAQVAGLPREYLLGHPRPALIKDFFEPGFTVTLNVRNRIKTVTVGISLGQHDVPS